MYAWKKYRTNQQSTVEALEAELYTVYSLIDDILYVPGPKFDENGDEIMGNACYLLNTPIQTEHLPALRAWFVEQSGGVDE